MDAERGSLVQNLELSWRYSIGNPYEEFSFPESIDGAQVMTELGFGPVGRSILRVSLTRRATPYPGWTMGEKLLGAAVVRAADGRHGVPRLSRTPKLAGYVAALAAPAGAGAACSSRSTSPPTSRTPVQGLHAQAVVWEGLGSMAAVWRAPGTRSSPRAPRRRRPARGGPPARGRALGAAAPGRLALPADAARRRRAAVCLGDRVAGGSYWNLVAPYALASGFFPPESAQAKGRARLPPRARIAAARARSRRRLRALRPGRHDRPARAPTRSTA